MLRTSEFNSHQCRHCENRVRPLWRLCGYCACSPRDDEYDGPLLNGTSRGVRMRQGSNNVTSSYTISVFDSAPVNLSSNPWYGDVKCTVPRKDRGGRRTNVSHVAVVRPRTEVREERGVTGGDEEKCQQRIT